MRAVIPRLRPPRVGLAGAAAGGARLLGGTRETLGRRQMGVYGTAAFSSSFGTPAATRPRPDARSEHSVHVATARRRPPSLRWLHDTASRRAGHAPKRCVTTPLSRATILTASTSHLARWKAAA